MDPDRPIGQQAHHLPETARPRPLRRAVDQRLVGRPVAVGPARAARRRVAPTVEGAVEEQRRDARRCGRRLVAEQGARHQTLGAQASGSPSECHRLCSASHSARRHVASAHREASCFAWRANASSWTPGPVRTVHPSEPRYHRASRPRVAERLVKFGSMVRGKVTRRLARWGWCAFFRAQETTDLGPAPAFPTRPLPIL